MNITNKVVFIPQSKVNASLEFVQMWIISHVCKLAKTLPLRNVDLGRLWKRIWGGGNMHTIK